MPAVNLSPIGNGFQFLYPSGLPLNGGLLNTYTAGTNTPLTTYTDSAGTIANSNPIVLGADGRPPGEIWLVVGSAYKFILTDSLANPVGPTLDNIQGIATLNNINATGNTVLGGVGNTLNVSAGALVVSGGNTTIGNDLAVNGNTTLGNAGADSVTVNASTISGANNPTVSGNWTFTGNTVVGDALGDTLSASGGALQILGDGRVAGNKLHNVGSLTGTNPGYIASQTYTPTSTNVTNVSSSTPQQFNVIRVGNCVMFSGTLTVTPTAVGGTFTEVDFSLPIASAFVAGTELAGTCNVAGGGNADLPIGVGTDFTNDRASVFFVASGIGGARTVRVSGMYVVV